MKFFRFSCAFISVILLLTSLLTACSDQTQSAVNFEDDPKAYNSSAPQTQGAETESEADVHPMCDEHDLDENLKCKVCGRYSLGGLNMYPTDDGEGYMVCYCSPETPDVIIPSEYNGLPVTEIAGGAFNNCTDVKSVYIPNSVRTIGAGAFKSCTSLVEINIPDSVTVIEPTAFSGCTSLESIAIPDGVTQIGNGMFDGCTSLRSVKLSDKTELVETYAFNGCDLLEFNVYDNGKYLGSENNPYMLLFSAVNKDIVSCKINKQTKIIYDFAFEKCDKLVTVEYDAVCALESIGKGAFKDCYYLDVISVPSTVKRIKSGAFENCAELTNNTIYNNACYIGNSENPYLILLASYNYMITSCNVNANTRFICDEAFQYCTRLTTVTLPDGLISIGYSAFSGCSSLTDITVPSSITKLENGTFSSCSNLKTVTFGENSKLEEIGEYAFTKCLALTHISLPDGVVTIGGGAFKDSGIRKINISASVQIIGYEAFAECDGLAEPIFEDTNGWSISAGGTQSIAIKSAELADKSGAAYYLTKTYCFGIWYNAD